MNGNRVITLDTTDWRSIETAISEIKEVGSMQIGETSEGETICMDVGHDGEGDILITTVFQKNGWTRKNIYHTADLSCEELYEKEKA